MAFKVAVVCEDPTHDQYIVVPVIKEALRALGKARAIVRVVLDPTTRGFDDLAAKACEILERYGAISSLVVFVVDTDCEDGTPGRGDRRARAVTAVEQCQHANKALVLAAKQEVEVWALWGVRSDLGVSWSDVLAECDPKERFFEPLLTRQDRLRPDGGRKRLVDQSLSAGWQSLRGGCRELERFEDEARMIIEGAVS